MMKKHYTVATTPNGIVDVIIELEEMEVYDNLYEIVNLLNKYQEYVEELEEENRILEKGKMDALSLLGEKVDKIEIIKEVLANG